MTDAPEFDFWVHVIQETLKVARKIPDVTDSFLRSKVANYRALMRLEQNRIAALLTPDIPTINLVKSLPNENETKLHYEHLSRRMKRFKNLYQFYADVLHARLFLKGDDSITSYIVSLTVPEEVAYRRRQMVQEFPN